MQGLNDLFLSKDQYLDEVVILPVALRSGSSGSFSLPDGYVWTDFECIEFSFSSNSAEPVQTLVSTRVGKELLNHNPTNWMANGTFADGNNGNQLRCYVSATSSTEALWRSSMWNGSSTTTSITYYPSCVVGYKKRYATQNISKIIDVNGGNPVTRNQRYVLSIAKELGPDYLNRDLIVEAEVYNDGSKGGTVGWGDSGWIYHSGLDGGFGAKASVLNDTIVVQTGKQEVCSWSYHSGNPFGINDGHMSMRCRVKVWKVDQFVTNTDSQEHARTYPTPWQPVQKGGPAENFRWAPSVNISSVPGECMWRWADESTIQTVGIFRNGPSAGMGSAPFAFLPTGYKNGFDAYQHLGFTSTRDSSHFNSYGALSTGAVDLKMSGGLSSAGGAWGMYDWTIVVKKV